MYSGDFPHVVIDPVVYRDPQMRSRKVRLAGDVVGETKGGKLKGTGVID